jgi:glycosyltransferase involved in cell wall biosynthesis
MEGFWPLVKRNNMIKAAYLVTGSGDSFYCGNCHRDRLYVSSLKKTGKVNMLGVPLYLPPIGSDFGDEIESPVFFGAVSMFLRERVKMFEHMPGFMDKILDAPPLLRLAARKAGATRTEGFEETTINMIRGDMANTAKEARRLADYLSEGGKPDIIHLANALIMGLGRQLKELLGSKIVCSLQNEDEWIDEMVEPYRSQAWDLIKEGASNIDLFISPSEYFKRVVVEKTGIEPDSIHVVPSGLDEVIPLYNDRKSLNPAIGYYSRLSYQNGLDKLVDAYIDIMKNRRIPSLDLHICGGYTADNKTFINEQLKKLRKSGFDDRVKLYPSFSGKQKEEFFNSINLMSVPVRKYDAYGLYILTANSAGVPVVQPATGAYPEIIEQTGGGVLYSPDTVQKLGDTICETLEDSEKINEMGKRGRAAIEGKLSSASMAEKIFKSYNEVLT